MGTRRSYMLDGLDKVIAKGIWSPVISWCRGLKTTRQHYVSGAHLLNSASPTDQYSLGTMYENGKGVPQDYALEARVCGFVASLEAGANEARRRGPVGLVGKARRPNACCGGPSPAGHRSQHKKTLPETC